MYKLRKLNFNKLKYTLRRAGFRMIPRKYRKPMILFFSILGLIGYLNFMIYLSESIYLIQAKQTVAIAWQSILTLVDGKLLLLFFGLLAILVIYHYLLDSGSSEGGKGKKSTHNSWYREVNGIISLLYFVITILAVLPFVLGFLV